MHAKTPPTRPLPPPAFQPLIGPPAQWRPQVLHHLTRTAQQQRAILIHDDPVFAHHLHATLEHADLRVCSLTPKTHPRSAHAATVVLSPDLHAVWRLLLHEDALTSTVRPTTLFLLLSPNQMLVPYLPEHVPFVIASSCALHVQTIIFDLDAQLGAEHGRSRSLGYTAACRTEEHPRCSGGSSVTHHSDVDQPVNTFAFYDTQQCGEHASPACLTSTLSSPDLHLVLQVLHRIEVSVLVEPFQIARLPHEWRALLIHLYGGHVLETCDLEHTDIIHLDELHNTFHWDVALERPVSRAFNLPDSALCQLMQDRGLARDGLGWLFLHPTPLELAPTDRPAFERHVQHWQTRWGSTGDTVIAWARWMDWQHTLTRIHTLFTPAEPT